MIIQLQYGTGRIWRDAIVSPFYFCVLLLMLLAK